MNLYGETETILDLFHESVPAEYPDKKLVKITTASYPEVVGRRLPLHRNHRDPDE
jgi:hypothetical protein